MSSPGKDEVLVPAKRKWVGVTLIGIAFTAIGYWMTQFGTAGAENFWGYVVMIFFGLVAVIGVLQLIPDNSYLHIGPEGITVRNMWRSHFYRWSDIERFGVAEIQTRHHGIMTQKHRFVAYNFSASYPGKIRFRELNRGLCGFDYSLPDNYGRDCAELAEHLNRLREHYLSNLQIGESEKSGL